LGKGTPEGGTEETVWLGGSKRTLASRIAYFPESWHPLLPEGTLRGNSGKNPLLGGGASQNRSLVTRKKLLQGEGLFCLPRGWISFDDTAVKREPKGGISPHFFIKKKKPCYDNVGGKRTSYEGGKFKRSDRFAELTRRKTGKKKRKSLKSTGERRGVILGKGGDRGGAVLRRGFLKKKESCKAKNNLAVRRLKAFSR